jgi:acyl carrier protein
VRRIDADAVRTELVNFLNSQSRQEEIDPKSLADDCDLLLDGLIDSLGLLELLTMLQEKFGQHVDFEALDPEQMTIVGPLCGFVVKEVAKA